MWRQLSGRPIGRDRDARTAKRTVVMALALAVFAAACGGGGDDSASTTTAAPTTAPETTAAPTTAAPTTTEAPWNVSEIEASVVRIVSQGSFSEIGGEAFSYHGGGSGFIIDEEGHVVTNNHVVTGAGLIEVDVEGVDGPVNARIVAVSECADLAVLDLEGDGYVPLEWYEGEIDEGIGVYSAGYPITNETTNEERDYTLTQGIVSSTNATGETGFASVDSVLEHDAQIHGGSSGGPLVADGGGVIGVNYAGLDSSGQNFAISSDEARKIVDQLLEGEDVFAIGVNGQAVLYDDGSSGVFVASVESGSPADLVGIEPGDWILELDGVVLATEGTMREYCDVLRTNGPDDQIAVRVLRPSTEEILDGRLNGAELSVEFSFADEFDENVDNTAAGEEYGDYVSIVDDSQRIAVEVPAAWADVDGRENTDFGPSIYAAPDISGFLDTWDTPGVIVEASPGLGPADIESVLAVYDFSANCTDAGRTDYEDPLYTGQLHLYTDCGGQPTAIIALAAVPEDGSFLIRLLIQATEPRDLAAADRILNTFFADFS